MSSPHQAAPLTWEQLAEYRATSAFFVKPTHFDVVKLIATIDARDATIAEQAQTIARLQQIEERAKEQLAGYDEKGDCLIKDEKKH